MTDEPLRPIGYALFEAARELDTETMLVEIRPRKSNGEEPPPAVAEMMKAVDVVLCPTSKSLTHTDARRAASAAGARVGTLPGVTEAIMIRCMNADYHRIADRTFRLCALLERSKTVRVGQGTGRHRHHHADRRPGGARQLGAVPRRRASGATCRPARPTSRRSRDSRNGVVVVDGSMAGVGLTDDADPDHGEGRLRRGHRGWRRGRRH